MTAKKLNRRQARWSLELANFDFTLLHKPGRAMGKADALSRRPDFEKGERDNEDVILIEPHHLRRMSVEIEDEGVKLLERIQGEKEVERVVKQKLLLKEKEWREENGLILWQNRVYIPPNRKLRKEVILRSVVATQDNTRQRSSFSGRTGGLGSMPTSTNMWLAATHANVPRLFEPNLEVL